MPAFFSSRCASATAEAIESGSGLSWVRITHDNPDPDSMASAVALAHLLEKKAGMECTVGYGGIIGRAENIAFVKILKLPVVPVSQLIFDEFDLIGLVDTQE